MPETKMEKNEVIALVFLCLTLAFFSLSLTFFVNTKIIPDNKGISVTGYISASKLIAANYWAPIMTTRTSCTDSDKGKNYYTYGYVYTGGQILYNDMCKDSKTLIENYCANRKRAYVYYTCPYGCSDGKCRSTPLLPDTSICTSNSQCQSNACVQDLDITNFGCCSAGSCWYNGGNQCLANGYVTSSMHNGPGGLGYYKCLNGYWVRTEQSQVKIKGFRFDPSYYYGQGYTAKTLAAKIASDAQNNNANTIFIFAYMPGGAYYPTTYADTNVEQGFGMQNMLGEMITAAHAKNIKVVAWLPVNSFQKAWENHPDWREKKLDGTDYVPNVMPCIYTLSSAHDSFQAWYRGFLEDILTRYLSLDGIEAAEGMIDCSWSGSADYNPAANTKYFAAYPSGKLGDANWISFRAGELTKLHKILIEVAHSHGKQAYVVNTWSTKSDGHLMLSSEIRDGCGFDFDGVMNLADKPDYIMAELIWQSLASMYYPVSFTPDWTKQGTQEFVAKVNSRTKALVHVELTPFGNYAPTNSQFQTSLQHAITGTSGADFYDSYQCQTKNAWSNVKAVYSAS